MLRGISICLTEVRQEDITTMYSWINDAETVRFNAPWVPVTWPNHSAWFDGITNTHERVVLAIRRLSDPTIIGIVQLLNIHTIHRNAELTMRIGIEEDRGKGYGTEALKLAVEFAWNDLNLQRVWLQVFSNNSRAVKAYQKAGFSIEGQLIRAAWVDGEWKDQYIMSNLRDMPIENLDSKNKTDWSNFTETAYAEIIEQAKSQYRFSSFTELGEDRHVIWRHDLDHSVHRGLRLAEIERDKGVKATCFFLLDDLFYDLAEPPVRDKAKQIIAYGHYVGLHYNPALNPAANSNLVALEEEIARQRDRLSDLLGHTVEAVSFHNPTLYGLLAYDQPSLAGLANVYSRGITSNYAYCSDSNGYWRFDSLPDIIASNKHKRLHVLTHPEWWTPEPMPPRDRIERCALGRAQACMSSYDIGMKKGGRDNIGG